MDISGSVLFILTQFLCRTFIPLSVSLWNDIGTETSMGPAGFKSRANAFLFANKKVNKHKKAALSYYGISSFFPFSPSVYRLVL